MSPFRHRPVSKGLGLVATRMSVQDTLGTAVRTISARPGRAVMTCAGTILGIGALVATISLTKTAQEQISSEFAALEVNELLITAEGPEAFSPDAVERLRRRADVRAAGMLAVLDRRAIDLRRSPYGPVTTVQSVHAVGPELMEVLEPEFVWGRAYDAGVERRRTPVILLSETLARRLDIRGGGSGTLISVDEQPFAVGGVYRDVRTHNELLLSAMIPPGVAKTLGLTGEREFLSVFTVPGAAAQVGRAAALVLDPAAPGRFTVVEPPNPRELRRRIDASVTNLLLLLAGVALAVSGLGIANTTLTAVVERSGEIGLKRAVGARRRHIAAEVMVETGMLGALGSVAGVWIGVMITVLASAAMRWQPVLDPRPLWIGPISGLLVGLLAGLYPALRAANMQPAEVLKR